MRMMPCAALCQCALHTWEGHVDRAEMSEISQSSRTTTPVELSIKSEHNLYLVFDDSPQRAFFFCTFSSGLALLLYTDFVAFSFSMPPTVGCVQYATPQNTYIAEDQPHCPTRLQLSRSAVLLCPPDPLLDSFEARPSKNRKGGSGKWAGVEVYIAEC